MSATAVLQCSCVNAPCRDNAGNSTVLVTTLNIVVVASVAVAVTEIGTVIITMIEVGIGIEVGRDENQM